MRGVYPFAMTITPSLELELTCSEFLYFLAALVSPSFFYYLSSFPFSSSSFSSVTSSSSLGWELFFLVYLFFFWLFFLLNRLLLVVTFFWAFNPNLSSYWASKSIGLSFNSDLLEILETLYFETDFLSTDCLFDKTDFFGYLLILLALSFSDYFQFLKLRCLSKDYLGIVAFGDPAMITALFYLFLTSVF